MPNPIVAKSSNNMSVHAWAEWERKKAVLDWKQYNCDRSFFNYVL